MAATGKTPILLYGSTTATNQPSAGNLTNSSDGCEIAINVADKNLFFKDSTNAVNTVPIRQSSGSSDGWLSSVNWTTFNSKQAAYTNLTSIGSLANATGWLYNNGSGTFSYSTPSASDVGAVPTSRTVSTTSPLAGGGALSSNLTLSITQATTSTSGYLSSTDWNTFNNKQPAGSYALTTGNLSQFASTTSAQLAGVISDETGSGNLVFANAPTLTNPNVTGNINQLGGVHYWGYTTQQGFLSYSGGWPIIGANTGYGLYLYADGVNKGYLDTSGNLGLYYGNLVIGTSGKGIDFSVTSQAAGMTSELLADYEEGTWTPVLYDAGSTTGTWDTTLTGRYTKTGRMVTCIMKITGTTMAFASTSDYRAYSGLPYAPTLESAGVFSASTLALMGSSTCFTNSRVYLAAPKTTTSTSEIYMTITYQAS